MLDSHKATANRVENALAELTPPAVSGEQITHVLIPVELSALDRRALTIGLQMAEAHRAQATILYVAPGSQQTYPMHWLDAIDQLHGLMSSATQPPPTDATSIDRLRAKLNEFVNREVPQETRRRVELRTECRFGETADEIVAFADESAVDLIVLTGMKAGSWFPYLPAKVRNVLKRTQKQVIVVRCDAPEKTNGAPHQALESESEFSLSTLTAQSWSGRV